MSGSEADYIVSVGAVVLRDGRILTTRRIRGWDIGHWRIPSGFPKPNETLPGAAIREVMEETGVRATSEGLLATRHLIYTREGRPQHEVHLVFKMAGVANESKPDNVEVDAAEFVSLEVFRQRETLSSVYVSMLEKALSGKECLREVHSSLKRPDIHLNVAYL